MLKHFLQDKFKKYAGIFYFYLFPAWKCDFAEYLLFLYPYVCKKKKKKSQSPKKFYSYKKQSGNILGGKHLYGG